MRANSLDAARFILYLGLVKKSTTDAIPLIDRVVDTAFAILERDDNLDITLAIIEAEVGQVQSLTQHHHIMSLELDIACARLTDTDLSVVSQQLIQLQSQLAQARHKISDLKCLQEQERSYRQEQIKRGQDWERSVRKRQRSSERETRRVKAAHETIKEEKEELARKLEEAEARIHRQPRINDCGVCFQSRPAVALYCGHVFCRSCLDRWEAIRDGSEECAICRRVSPSRVPL